jgi:hypothetical protein
MLLTRDSRGRLGEALAVLLALSGLSAACERPLSANECERLLDHYAELLIKEHRPRLSGAERLKIKADTRIKAGRDPAFLRCSKEVLRSDFECAIQAETPDQLERCLL